MVVGDKLHLKAEPYLSVVSSGVRAMWLPFVSAHFIQLCYSSMQIFDSTPLTHFWVKKDFNLNKTNFSRFNFLGILNEYFVLFTGQEEGATCSMLASMLTTYANHLLYASNGYIFLCLDFVKTLEHWRRRQTFYSTFIYNSASLHNSLNE